MLDRRKLMRSLYIGILLLVTAPIFICSAHGDEPASSISRRGELFAFRAIENLPGDSLSGNRIAYGDNQGYLHILKQKDKGFSEEWKSRNLGAGIMQVFAEDINADRKPELVTYISKGQIFIFDPESHTVLWQSNELDFRSIGCMTIADVDGDPQRELVFCADSYLYVYDGMTLFEQWKSEGEFEAQDIVIADVDGDGQKEIVLNTGYVLDARFHDLEWQSPEPFGDRLRLLDLDNDGIPEVIGEFGGHFLKVFDIDLRREKW